MGARGRIVEVVSLGLWIAVAGCGGGSTGGGTVTTTGNPAPTGFVITISGLAYSPVSLSVPPGATITVVNNDNMLHSVTSEASPGAFVRGGVAGISFDTGEFSSGQRTIQIPSTAASGTVVPFYCTAHLSTMATPTGSITIDPAAQPPTTSQPPSAAPAPAY